MFFSLVLHGLALSLLFLLSSSLAKPDKSIIIDFTVDEPSGPSAPPAHIPQKKTETTVPAKKLSQTMPLKQKALYPAPVVQPEGLVPMEEKPYEPTTLPAGQPQHAATASVPTVSSQVSGITAGDTVEQLSDRYRSENFAYIKKIIEDNLSYPRRAQQMGWSGRVVVSLDVAKNGHVQEIRIVSSSGHKLLDANLVETIRKVEPFPKPPASVTLNIPISYKLR